MQYTNLIWRDGEPYSEIFDDIYYSSDADEGVAGESEFQHVFFRHNGLPQRWQACESFAIAELGFGSGLNCVLTMREWLRHCEQSGKKKILHYIAIEKYPLSADSIAELLGRYPDLKEFSDELVVNYPPAVEATHICSLFGGSVVIHFKFMGVDAALSDTTLSVDAWFLDGFSPAKNPDMWSQNLFLNIAKNSHSGTTCSTYTAAGSVRRNLEAAGFLVKKVNGHGKKREMLVAELIDTHSVQTASKTYHYKEKPWFELPVKNDVAAKRAVIVGAGIAGLSLSYALVQRGWTVTIIDKHGDHVEDSSSNPAPIVYPRISVDNDTDMAFYTQAYCYALYLFKKLQAKHQKRFWFDDGLLQLMDKKRIVKIVDKYQLNSDFISFAKSGFSGREEVLISYETAGVVLPKILCELLKKECGNKLNIIKQQVTAINRENKQWRCRNDSDLISESEILIIANGTAINNLGVPHSFPVESIRGQVMILDENTKSKKIKKTLNAAVHITPAINAKHYLGASYSNHSIKTDVSESDNKELLESLSAIYPDIFDKEDYSDAWVGFRCISKDRVPIVGVVPDQQFFESEYSDINTGSNKRLYKPGRYLEGLYISAAHGSRGFTSSFISAEIIVSQIMGEPSPVNKTILDYLNPSRFIVNDLKRR